MRMYRPEIDREINAKHDGMTPINADNVPKMRSHFPQTFSAKESVEGSIVHLTEAHSRYATTHFDLKLVFIDNTSCCKGCSGSWAEVTPKIYTVFRIGNSHQLYDQVVEHEQRHYDAAVNKSIVIDGIAKDLNGNCEHDKCHLARRNLIQVEINLEIAWYNFDQARFDCLDKLGSVVKCTEMQELLTTIQIEDGIRRKFAKNVNKEYSK